MQDAHLAGLRSPCRLFFPFCQGDGISGRWAGFRLLRNLLGMERGHRTTKELEGLWEKLEDLKRLESGLVASSARTVEQIKDEITTRLGCFPPFYLPAAESATLLESLWRQQLSSYLENPLPQQFKQKVALHLSRFCVSPYFVIEHACLLYQFGVEASEIRRLIETPTLSGADAEHIRELLATYPHPIETWPEGDRDFEDNLIACCAGVFLGLAGSQRSASELRELLGATKYGHLTAILAYTKGMHLWVEAHPEIAAMDHPVVRANLPALLRSEPLLDEVFRNHRVIPVQSMQKPEEPADGAAEDVDLYRELFENASDIIYTHDFEGRLLSINRAVERITGYTRAEALQLKLTDMIAPEYAHLGAKMIDRQIGGEVPLNYELEFIAKDNRRVAFGISTRPIFRGGKPIAVQGIARDITKRRKTEEALQEANQKLEAWVSELQQRTREMALLDELGDILRACLTTEEAYHVIVRVAQQIFPVQVGALYVISPSRNVVEAAAVWGNPELVEKSFPPQECWALRRGRTHLVEDADTGMLCRHINQPPREGYMCIPMMAQSEALGVLHLMQPDGIKMTDTKQRLAITMSEHIAMALSNLRLHETLRSQSIRDPLTGLFNRRFMEESLELEIRRATRNQRPLGMIMIDLDHFKYFNDNFGHEAGDLVLKALGTLLRSNIRGEDIACRYGGEEFTLILPEGTKAVTRQRAEFFKDAIQRLDVHFRGNSLGKVTASMGVAVFPDHGRTASDLIDAADKALYRSKAAGRDRVTLAG
jgi:diguanylate cyclase (GGDEF)-like protein/PAS domain S-box-containing protein